MRRKLRKEVAEADDKRDGFFPQNARDGEDTSAKTAKKDFAQEDAEREELELAGLLEHLDLPELVDKRQLESLEEWGEEAEEADDGLTREPRADDGDGKHKKHKSGGEKTRGSGVMMQ